MRQVAFVVNTHNGRGNVQLGKNVFRYVYVHVEVFVGYVQHVQHKVGVCRFFEGRLECVNQLVRQIVYEADSVGNQQFHAVNVGAANGGVEGCKQLVVGINVLTAQAIEKG